MNCASSEGDEGRERLQGALTRGSFHLSDIQTEQNVLNPHLHPRSADKNFNNQIILVLI